MFNAFQTGLKIKIEQIKMLMFCFVILLKQGCDSGGEETENLKR